MFSKLFNKTCGLSQKSSTVTLKCRREYNPIMLRKHTSIRCLKKPRKPLRTPSQLKNMRPFCRKLHKNHKNKIFILDDESYFTLSNSTLAGNNCYYTDDKVTTPDHIKHKLTSKYEEKILVWVAFSSKGVSKPYFVPSKQAINRFVYFNKCIKPRLIPFIKRHKKYIFWPDEAGAHYSNLSVDYLRKNKIEFVEKKDNLANVLEARPIEDFWGDLKRLVYK